MEGFAKLTSECAVSGLALIRGTKLESCGGVPKVNLAEGVLLLRMKALISDGGGQKFPWGNTLACVS